jgi:hypothetical protein
VERKNRGLRLVAVAMSLCAVAGCVPKAEPTTVALPSGTQIESRQARVWIYEIADRLAGEIERSADEIRAAAEEPRARRAALEWKTEGVPALYRAAFQPDIVIAVADMWLLIVQMQQFFESGAGREWLGEHADEAAETSRRMERDLVDFIKSVGGDPEQTQAGLLVHEFAAQNPILASIASRPTAAAALADRLRTGKIGTFEAVGTLVEGFGELSDRLSVYGEQMPKQVRWQAELLLFDKGLEHVDVDALLAETERLGRLADHTMEFTDGLPELIDGRIEANLPRVVAALEQVRLEAAMGDVDAMIGRHVAVAVEVIESERELLLQAVREEREVTMREAEQMAGRFLDDSFDRVEAMVEERTRGLMPLALLAAGGPFVLGLVLGLVLRRRPAA